MTLALAGTNSTNGGLTVKAVTMGASSSNNTSNTVQVKLDAAVCNGHAAPASAVPLI